MIMMLMPMMSLYADNLSLELNHANLADALRFIANAAKMDVIVSPSVGGSLTLTVNNALPMQVLDSVIGSERLARWQVGKIWYIGTQDEFIKMKQQEVKLVELEYKSQRLQTKLMKIRYANANDIVRVIQGKQSTFLSARGKIQVDSRTNAILIEDIEEKINSIADIVYRLDIPVKQIMIETRLASVDTDCERELGVDFTVRQTEHSNDYASIVNTLTHPGQYSIAVAQLPDGSMLDIKLSALERQGHAELISKPRLFTANQQTAYIESGEEVPYQEVSESGGTAVTFKKAVLGLRVVPQILPGDKVLLQLKINQDRPGVRMVQGVPTISTRQMVTSVLVKNGATVVLGGIFEQNKETGVKRIPFLADIPLLGRLFQIQQTRSNKRELLIFVTPRIM